MYNITYLVIFAVLFDFIVTKLLKSSSMLLMDVEVAGIEPASENVSV